MKRVISLMILLLTLLFAINAAENHSKTIDIWGYYKSGGAALAMIVSDVGGNRLYETEALVRDSNLESSGDTIFNWQLSGNSNNKTVKLKFTFDTFQAVMRQVYYRPAYKITISRSTTNATQGEVEYTAESQDHRYTETFAKEFTGIVTENNAWTGTCTLKITDYAENVLPAEENAYNFRCRVKVEVTMQ